jgi:hypothetical protein
MNRLPQASTVLLACALLAAAACSSKADRPGDMPSPASAATLPSAVVVHDDEEKCSNEPRAGENDQRPRCGGMGVAPAVSHAYRVVGGSGDPVDQIVCDITGKFVLDGKMFGVEFSGGVDGTYRFVRTPNIHGLNWKAGGRYHIEFADGEDLPGTMTTEGGGTTTAGAISRNTAGAEHFTLTPVEPCK